jgi:hypothetical protein
VLHFLQIFPWKCYTLLISPTIPACTFSLTLLGLFILIILVGKQKLCSLLSPLDTFFLSGYSIFLGTLYWNTHSSPNFLLHSFASFVSGLFPPFFFLFLCHINSRNSFHAASAFPARQFASTARSLGQTPIRCGSNGESVTMLLVCTRLFVYKI